MGSCPPPPHAMAAPTLSIMETKARVPMHSAPDCHTSSKGPQYSSHTCGITSSVPAQPQHVNDANRAYFSPLITPTSIYILVIHFFRLCVGFILILVLIQCLVGHWWLCLGCTAQQGIEVTL